MIQITRTLARQLRSIMRRALNLTSSAPQTAVVFQAGPEGLRVRARNFEAAVEYHQPGSFAPEWLSFPFDLLADCEGRKADPVILEAEPNGNIASWRDGAIPQVVRYEVPRGRGAKDDEFPAAPDNFAPNEPRLWLALQDAAQTADSQSVRYSLGCLQLRATGQIVATDGRQVLVQGGFAFPWTTDLLVPVNKLFGCRDLLDESPILVGNNQSSNQDWIVFRTGPWTVHVAIQKEGRFPQVDELKRDAAAAVARWELSATDAEFLLENLPKLPLAEDDFDQRITIELNGTAIVRAKADESSPATEVVLTNSSPSGQAICLAMNRHYLARALRLGFREILIYGTEAPLLCHDAQRQYMWATLESLAVVASGPDAIRIESHSAPMAAAPTQPRRNRMAKAKPRLDTNDDDSNGQDTNGRAVATETDAAPVADNLVAEALALRQSLQDALGKTNSLIAMLKRQGRQTRLIESTLRSLRQLQATG